MKYFVRKNEWKNSNGSNRLDVETMRAYSYDWWCYVSPIAGTNKLLFNDYNYSPTTGKHQGDMISLLSSEFGYSYYSDSRIVIVKVEGGLTGDHEADILAHIKGLQGEIDDLRALVNKPRTTKKKNAERLDDIDHTSSRILTLCNEFGLSWDKSKLFRTNTMLVLKSA